MKVLCAFIPYLAACTLVHAASPPNILLAVADDWGMHAGTYGCAWIKTPHFDRVAKSGLLFENAYTPNAKCAPSRACMLTGRNSWQLKQAANHWCFFPTEFKTWPESLAEHGWHVGHTNKGWAPGIALGTNGKPRQLTGKAWNQHRCKPPTPQISNNDYAANFDAFLDAAPEGKPWVFWYGAGEPHRGYDPGSALRQGRQPRDIDRVPGYWPDNETVRSDMLDYALEVEHFDTHLGRMLVSLEKRGQLDNTLVIVTSDHGMPFPRCKGQAYDGSNRVPLAMMWPKKLQKPGRRINGYVSLIDLAPTIIKLAGLEWNDTGMAPSPGLPLDAWFSPTGTWPRTHVLIGKERHDVGRPNDEGYPIRGVVWNNLLYLRNFATDRWPSGNPETGYLNTDGGTTKTNILEAHRKDASDRHWALCFGKRPAVELYDLKSDPDCLNNVADSHPQSAKLNQLLESELKADGDPRMTGDGTIFDRYPYADKARRNFYQRFTQGEKIETRWVNPGDFER